jgi:hypothetical protein
MRTHVDIEALGRSRKDNQTAVGAWLLEQFR